MKVNKAATADANAVITNEALELINRYAKKELKAEEVFVFDIKLCDNAVDRDGERFSAKALWELSELFVGKTGIFDHQWSAGGQKARIFKTQVVEDAAMSGAMGEPYTYLKASAYMLRAGNDELISEIEGGIKKEVSVGCSMGKAVCSICGEERGSGKCGHTAGAEYNGRTSFFTLEEAKDAYEWSFVAVPAQKEAGIIKKFAAGKKAESLEGLVGEYANEAVLKEFLKLKEEAAMGRSYVEGLKAEVVRLGVLSKSGFEAEFLKSAAEKLSVSELLSFKAAFEKRADELLPRVSQLGANEEKAEFDGREFLI